MDSTVENRAMDPATPALKRTQIGRWIGIGVVGGAIVLLLLAVWLTDLYPRTDDASVRANFIGITPEVSGRLMQLPVKDNAFVKKG